jgi:FkbH-like protein
LWKGVCGEDGATGVQIEGPYLELQQFMLQKYNQGMLLTLCSKNNEPDVWEVFEKNPGMLLKKDHFVDWAIDWNPKSTNLAALASRLNLGIDSFILVDDSPAECSEIMTRRPEVLTLQLPADPAYIPGFLKHVWAFDKLKITGEDRQRSRMYLDDRERRESLGKSISLDDFLAGLELKVAMNIMNPSQVSRVSQLTQRTNQFNLSTRRRTEEEIETLTRQHDMQCWVIEVGDRFGAYGLAGVVITRRQPNELVVDTFLLSCRVLGRRVEEVILVGMRNFCREQGLRVLRADYYPTPKNKPIHTFLETRWEKGPQNQSCTTYMLTVDQIPESVEQVDFYYLHTFEKELPEVPEVPDALPLLFSHPSAGNAFRPAMNAMNPEPTGNKKNPWEINIVNSEHLLYRHYFLPLENCTAEKLLRLPLPQNPGDRPRGRTKSEIVYEPPRDAVEAKLVDIWSELLGMPREMIGIASGFFELGGSSLGVIKLLSEINRTFAVEVPIERLFVNVKIKEIAKYIDDLKEKHEEITGGPARETPVMLLNDPGSRPIFLFPPIVGYGIGYRALAKHIDNSSLYAFNYIETEDRLKIYAAHIAGIREKGPLVLGGYSAGGNLAFEVTKELEKQGYEVAAVIMMDSFPKTSRFSQETADENHSFKKVVTEAMGNYGLEFLKEEVVGKLNHYAHYFNHLENRGKVNADIYFVIAEETEKSANRPLADWEEYTQNTSYIFHGFGKHEDMFNPGYVEKNAGVIKAILEQVLNLDRMGE